MAFQALYEDSVDGVRFRSINNCNFFKLLFDLHMLAVVI